MILKTRTKESSVKMIGIAFLCIVQLSPIQSMEPFIVGGEPAKIEYYSHSAYLSIETGSDHFACGSSIINQNVLLSAGHCFEDVTQHSMIVVRAGSANRLKGTMRFGQKYAVHKNYNPDTVENDIALVFVKHAFALGTYIKRIILMKNPPNAKLASVAGWGLIDERKQVDSDWLQHTQQKLLSRSYCNKILNKIPVGTFCAGAKSSKHYAASGDSGSALVIDGKIQVGLVSFKRPHISRSMVVYTDVPYFYDWIVLTAKILVCQ